MKIVIEVPDERGVSSDIPCHTTLCIKCNLFEQCRFSSQEARDMRVEMESNNEKDN